MTSDRFIGKAATLPSVTMSFIKPVNILIALQLFDAICGKSFFFFFPCLRNVFCMGTKITFPFVEAEKVGRSAYEESRMPERFSALSAPQSGYFMSYHHGKPEFLLRRRQSILTSFILFRDAFLVLYK